MVRRRRHGLSVSRGLSSGNEVPLGGTPEKNCLGEVPTRGCLREGVQGEGGPVLESRFRVQKDPGFALPLGTVWALRKRRELGSPVRQKVRLQDTHSGARGLTQVPTGHWSCSSTRRGPPVGTQTCLRGRKWAPHARSTQRLPEFVRESRHNVIRPLSPKPPWTTRKTLGLKTVPNPYPRRDLVRLGNTVGPDPWGKKAEGLPWVS